jgi:hypothetical protein
MLPDADQEIIHAAFRAAVEGPFFAGFAPG